VNTTTLRIGYVTAFPPGRNSLNEYGYHFVTHLAAKPEVSEVVLYADRTDAGPPQAIDKTSADACWSFNDAGNVFKIVKAVRRSKPDAVIFNLQFATFGDTKVAGGLGLLSPALLRLMGTPTIVILHNLADNVNMQDAGFAGSKLMASVMQFAGRMLTRVILRADMVGLTIPRYVEQVRDNYGAKNVFLAPHGAFEDIAQPSFKTPEGPRQILAFGKWGTYKTVDALIDAYRQLLSRGYDDCEVIIAGTDSPNSPGYLADVAARNADLPGLKFTGYVKEEDVAGLFAAATTVAFPYTSTTGSSGVLHQCGNYGRSAVLPRIGDFLEVIEEEGFRGEYFTPDDASSLADAISKLLDDSTLREELGRRNYAAAAGIPMSEVVDWYLIHLDRLMAGRKAR
jgi:glycosyltransferase involved in cell wall biosynthesis